MRRAAVLLCAAALAGCGGGGGGGGGAEGVVSDAAANLEEIRSGNLEFRLLVEPKDEEGRVGFALNGPFRLTEPGELPVMRVDYTQFAGTQDATVTVIATGDRAYVETGGEAYELPERQTEELRAATRELNRDGLDDEFEIGDWIVDPKEVECEQDGELECVRSTLDVAAATDALLRLARDLGSDVGELSDEDRDRLEQSVRSSELYLAATKDDRLLRALSMKADFGFDVPRALRTALGSLVGARVTFELEIDDPNADVDVAAPANPRPYSELEG